MKFGRCPNNDIYIDNYVLSTYAYKENINIRCSCDSKVIASESQGNITSSIQLVLSEPF